MERRDYLKTAGGIGATTLLGGAGLLAASGTAAATSGLTMGASNPSKVANDRGDLSKVTVDPTFRVEWENFDTAVGKVLILVEARTREDGSVQGAGWTPICRTTPWLTEDKAQNGGPHIDYSKPGTTGYFEITGTLGQMLAYASRVRTGDTTPQARQLEVVNEIGRPDYEAETFPDYTSVDTDSYLGGSSLGSADQTFDTIGGQIVNNFPGANAGYYGAAIDTSNFDVDDDGTTDADTVELRYTMAFLTVDDSADLSQSWYEHVRPSDVVSGNSELVMNGEDGYPDITNHGAGSAASKDYSALQSVADSHPAVLTATSSFQVTVENEGSGSSGSGSADTGASGSGQ